MDTVRKMVSVAVLALTATSSQAVVTGYYRFPTIHGNTIVFSAEGDLWKVSTDGGLAMRLTTHEGNESFAKFSPDGRWIAFSGEYQGNVDVYVMRAEGGGPRRLTYHPGADEVVAWRSDGQSVVFRSGRLFPHRGYNLFEAPVAGGHPKQVDIGVAALAAFSPDGKFIAFNRFSREFRTWKRYRGGRAQDIWVGSLKDKSFRKVTDWEGTDRFPMWYQGRVFFLSDRTGRLNIFSATPDGKDIRQHSDHTEYDVRWPDLHAGRTAYMYGGDLWLLDVESGETRRIEIQLPSDRVRRRLRFEDAAKTLDTYSLNHDGTKLAVSSRGEMWVCPTKKGRAVQLSHSSGIRERSPVFSPDGRRVACITDETGEQELAVFDAQGKVQHRIVTHRGQGWIFDPIWSPDGKHLAYADPTMTLFVVDAESGEITPIDTCPNWEITDYSFSPDGSWLAYVKLEENLFNSIYIFSLAEGKSYAVTTPFTNDYNPKWDPEGRYLYFISNRNYNPLVGQIDLHYIVTAADKPYAVILTKEEVSPFLPDELLEAHRKDKEDEENSAQGHADKEILPDASIDVEGIQERVVEFPVSADNILAGEWWLTGGNYLHAVRGKVFYASSPHRGLLDRQLFVEDTAPRKTLHVYGLKKKKAEVFIEKLRDFTFSGDGKRIAFRVEDEILIADTAAKPNVAEVEERINPAELSLAVDPADEWAQIFAETWRLQRDFYWAKNMANVDWSAMREKYARLLPRISTRHELNDLIGQLIGELGTSHTYVFGGDTRNAKQIGVGLLGADLEPDPDADALRFRRVLRAEPWETDVKAPLTMTHAAVQEGEYLFAIDGRDLTANGNVYAHLANLAGKQVLLTVGSKPDRSDVRDVQIEALPDEQKLRYRDWCRRNREYVERKTSGRIGYFHLPNMVGEGLVEFIKGYYPQINKEALIIDVRYNRGGFVSQMIIERLGRTVTAYAKLRRGTTVTFPYRTHAGHKVVIVNQHSSSDGDIFPESFKLRGLGPVIGMRTWGGVIGARFDKRFIDGGLSSQPEYAWWEPRRGWGLENRGVEPDIEIDCLPEDYIAGRDPQLDRAIAELEKTLDEQPVVRPAPPPIPDKSGVGHGGR